MKKILLSGILLLILFPVIASAATYYVSSSGSDANSGTQVLPWKTIAKVNSVSFSPGDFILFKRSETWRETLNVPSSGSAVSPITFGAYGTGDLPNIYGSAQVSTWANEIGNLWYATSSADASSIWLVGADGTIHWGEKQTAKANLMAEYNWWWDSANARIYVYAATDPDSRYTSIEKPTRTFCVENNNKDYITIKDLEIAYCSDIGVRVMAGKGWTVDGCTIHHIGVKNGALDEGVFFRGASSGIVQNCIIHDCGNHGTALYSDVGLSLSNIIVQHNTFYDNYHSDIDCQCNMGIWNGAIIRYNLLYNTADYDKAYTNGAIYVLADHPAPNDINGVEVYYNVIHHKNAGGIIIRGAVDSPKIYNNIIYGALAGSTTYAAGIHVFSNNPGTADPTSVVIKNNVVMDPYSECLRVTNKNYISACDNNCWYRSAGGAAVYVTGVSTSYHYNDFAAYKAATGWDTNGLWEDPKFANAANNDFSLAPGSPLINTGATVGLTQDYEGNTIPQGAAPDIGAFEYVSSTPPPQPVSGDLTGDGKVDVDDLIVVARNFGKTVYEQIADTNRDGVVDIFDIVYVASRFT